MILKNVYILNDRAILYINGEDAKIFLQNLISNNVDKVNDENSCFSSLLTPQGKFLYEFMIVKHKSGFLIDSDITEAVWDRFEGACHANWDYDIQNTPGQWFDWPKNEFLRAAQCGDRC